MRTIFESGMFILLLLLAAWMFIVTTKSYLARWLVVLITCIFILILFEYNWSLEDLDHVGH
ncbi:hypothetical protein NDK47_20830 [Brevibacillus ruminantium]|uniref:Uncharacterized protein n=1 Tax=Brevibacillus ruminantium TaxID=2950604 RepID=A0ABY4WBZ0_9BACL|nr:hypothetical protein [Brevibacillus ruminantium]USG64567.1 hypothetical protein NDK47_20830 [Brevibacillus ruminantium]